jgi:hypothetical protein
MSRLFLVFRPLAIVGMGLLMNPAFAQEKKDKSPAVIDFEADLIQGEAQRPDLMTQFGDKPMEIDSLLYLRRDFNDLHQGDASRRPSFFPAPKVLGGEK